MYPVASTLLLILVVLSFFSSTFKKFLQCQFRIQVPTASVVRKSSTVTRKLTNARLVIAIKSDLSICNATIWADVRVSRALEERNATGTALLNLGDLDS